MNLVRLRLLRDRLRIMAGRGRIQNVFEVAPALSTLVRVASDGFSVSAICGKRGR